MIPGKSDKDQRLEEILDDIIEIVQVGSDCEIHDVSPETWLAAKAKLLELVALQKET
jgi:hypothetical protein